MSTGPGHGREPAAATTRDAGTDRRHPAGFGPQGWVRHVALPAVAERLSLSRYARDRRLVGATPEALAARKVGYGVAGLALPVLLSAALLLMGSRLPVVAPLAAGVALGAVAVLAAGPIPATGCRQGPRGYATGRLRLTATWSRSNASRTPGRPKRSTVPPPSGSRSSSPTSVTLCCAPSSTDVRPGPG